MPSDVPLSEQLPQRATFGRALLPLAQVKWVCSQGTMSQHAACQQVHGAR